MSIRLPQFLKEPLVQFVLIGACIYGAYELFGSTEEQENERIVVVDANRINGFISTWEQRYNRPPNQEELDSIINTFVRDDILYRQALAMGLGEDDPITRKRLAQKLEFLTSNLAQMKEPREGELQQYFESNLQDYRDPDRITFGHVFIDPDARGDATLDDAAGLMEELRSAGAPAPAWFATGGDRFMLENYLEKVSSREIQRQFGSGFTDTVMQLKPGWHSPVLSGYGVHLVYVYSKQPADPPVFAEVEALVFENWQREQQQQFNADFFENLKSRYEILVDPIPAGRLLGDDSDTALAPDTAS